MMGPWISCLLGSLESFCLALPSSHQFTNLSLVLEETTISVLESQDRWALNNFQERFTMSWYGCMPFPFLLTSHKWWSGFGTMWWESVDWSQKQRDKPKDFEAHTSSFQIITPCHGDWHRGVLFFVAQKNKSSGHCGSDCEATPGKLVLFLTERFKCPLKRFKGGWIRVEFWGSGTGEPFLWREQKKNGFCSQKHHIWHKGAIKKA